MFNQIFLIAAVLAVWLNPWSVTGPIVDPMTDHASKGETRTITLGNHSFEVFLADTADERIAGLSGWQKLEENQGLLFIFPQPTRPNFWMKDMNFPIDLLWLDGNMEIVGIEKNLTPDSYPRTFSPNQPIKYVLEINAGLTDRLNLFPKN